MAIPKQPLPELECMYRIGFPHPLNLDQIMDLLEKLPKESVGIVDRSCLHFAKMQNVHGTISVGPVIYVQTEPLMPVISIGVYPSGEEYYFQYIGEYTHLWLHFQGNCGVYGQMAVQVMIEQCRTDLDLAVLALA